MSMVVLSRLTETDNALCLDCHQHTVLKSNGSVKVGEEDELGVVLQGRKV